jgi:hypothetical protein
MCEYVRIYKKRARRNLLKVDPFTVPSFLHVLALKKPNEIYCAMGSAASYPMILAKKTVDAIHAYPAIIASGFFGVNLSPKNGLL